MILNYLKSGAELTPLEALEKFGCFHLAGVVHSLRSEGYNIITNEATSNGKFGKKRFAKYKLAPTEKQKSFNF